MSTYSAGPDGRRCGDSVREPAAARSSPAGVTAGGSPAVVADAIRFIEDNLQEKLTVTWLADAAGTSRVKFTRMFKASTGTSPYRFIIERRLSKARQLLLFSLLPLGEVAYAAGFSSQSHMTSTFQRNVGVTPKQYRRVFAPSR